MYFICNAFVLFNNKSILPQMLITPSTTHAVHSGKYLIKTSAIRAEIKIRYACCNCKGPCQCIHIIPTTPKFHKTKPNVNKSIGMLYAFNTCLQKTFFLNVKTTKSN